MGEFDCRANRRFTLLTGRGRAAGLRRATVMVAVVVGLVAAGGCTQQAGEPVASMTSQPAGATSATASSAPVTTAPLLQPTATAPPLTTPAQRASAAGQLAGFFTAASAADRQLRRAADQLNSGVDAETIRLEPATLAAVRAIDTARVARAIPGGLGPELLRATLLVYADLSARRAAFNAVFEHEHESPLPRTGDAARRLLGCLAHGTAAAAKFEADLAAARALAAAAPAVPVVAADSRPAAEVAIRARHLDLGYNGCASCGGEVPRPFTLWPIAWQRVDLAPGSVWDGTIGPGMLFSARYLPGQGWQVDFNAC